MNNEVITYNGFRFIRYPLSENRSDQVYFRGHVKINGRWTKRYLHRYVWECEVGTIPEGYHIHHKDSDPSNNSLGNLDCKPYAEHISDHWYSTPNKLEQSVEALQLGKEKAKEWHASKEGQEWHRQNALKNGFGQRELLSLECQQCGASFNGTPQTKFCSSACRAKHRRSNKIDHVSCTCKRCGKEFMATRFKIPDCCSKSCGAKYRYR